MRSLFSLKYAVRGGTLALVLGGPGVAFGQDGQPPIGPPTTDPNTNKNRTPPGNTPPRPDRPLAEQLPPVPETATSPAPPGTRGVRVDVPGQGGGNPAIPQQAGNPAMPPQAGQAPGRAGGANAGRSANIQVAEGVVTRLDRAGKNLSGELIRFAFDPSQDWQSYMAQGAQGVASPEPRNEPARSGAGGNAQNGEARPAQDQANPGAAADTPKSSPPAEGATEQPANAPNVLEMALTSRTYIYTHARSEDGTDIYGAATSASPLVTSARTAPAGSTTTGRAEQPVPTNFTNIKEGSFVSVRYRKMGDLNEVLNLTLIERPLNPDMAGGAAGGSGGARTGIGGANDAAQTSNATGTGAGAAGTTRTGTTGEAGNPTAPAGAGTIPPSVPTTPAGPAIPR